MLQFDYNRYIYRRGADMPFGDLSVVSIGDGMCPPSSTLSYKVIVADGNDDTRTLIIDYLIKRNIIALPAKTKNELWKYIEGANVDLVVIDHALPYGDDLFVYNRIRSNKIKIPVIMLTAAEEEAVGRIVGLELGADDCVSKPINPRELLARINSIMRRDEIIAEWLERKQREIKVFGSYKLNLKTRALSKNGEKIAITPTEFAMLSIFMVNRNKWLTQRELHELIYGDDIYFSVERIKKQISRVREIIEDNPKKPQYLITSRNNGYVFIG